MKSVLILAILATCIAFCLSFKCRACVPENCHPAPTDCETEIVKDYCNCCEQCGKAAGDYCGGPLGTYGMCVKGTTCEKVENPDPKNSRKKLYNLGICKPSL